MPKELLHWWLASAAQQRLPLDSTTRQLLEEQQSAYLLGAVLPDTLLHLQGGGQHAMARQLADRFHDSQRHSYAPLSDFLARNPQLTPAQRACLLGVASHIETDIVFHPFVYALAGNDLGRHYRVETDLDLWLLHSNRRPPELELRELMTEEPANAAATVLAGVFDPQATLPADTITEALQQHARIQGRYGAGGWHLLARLLGCIPGTPFNRWQHLFYPLFNWRKGRAIQWPTRWNHPSSQSERGDTPHGLLLEALSRTSSLLRSVDESGLIATLRKQPGENLLTGLPPT
jgi:hypothetical protein